MKYNKINKIEGIVQGLTQGDERSMTLLYKEYYSAVTHFAYRFTNDKPAAEELAQTAFIKLWARKDQLENFDHLKAYLYTCVRNGWLNEVRNRQKSASRETKWMGMQEEPSNVMHQIIESEVLQQLHSAIGHLPAACRKVMNFLFIDGKSTREIAQELRISVSAVKNQKARGIRLLKKRLILSFYFFLNSSILTWLFKDLG